MDCGIAAALRPLGNGPAAIESDGETIARLFSAAATVYV